MKVPTEEPPAVQQTNSLDDTFVLRALLEHSPSGIAFIDPAFRFRHLNRRFAALNGPSVEAHLGKTVAEVAPLFWAAQGAELQRVLASGSAVTNIVLTGAVFAGTRTPADWVAAYFPVTADDGLLLGIRLVVEAADASTDSGRRDQAAAVVPVSDPRLDAVVKAANIGLWDWNLDTNEVSYSPEWKSQLGYAEHEISNHFTEWRTRLHADDLPQALQRVENYLANPTNLYESEFRLRHRDGSYRWILAQGSLLVTQGRRCLVGSHIDITERVTAEQGLRLRDRAIQAVSQGIVITDHTLPDDPIIFASEGFARLTGYTQGEVLGKNCRLLQGPDTDWEQVGRIKQAIRDGRAVTVELLNYRKDGSTFWNEFSLSPVRDEAGRVTHFVGVQVDVTARRNLEEQFRQAQKMEAVGLLAGGVAHDFNNLLTIINGYSEILLVNMHADDPMRDLLLEVYKAGERAVGLTRQLLAFSRQQVVHPKVLDLNEVVANLRRMLERLIGEDVILTTTLDSHAGSVKADPGQLEQLLVNLAVNARDAMPQGGNLTLETQRMPLGEKDLPAGTELHPGEYVLLTVSDTGTGMDAKTQARLFEPFFTTKGVGKGTGLGLATVLAIVRQAGGHIAVESAVGRGTTFRVYFPLIREEIARDEGHPNERTMPGGSETILLAEDEDAVRGMARHILKQCGYTVLEAANGKEALEVAAAHTGPIHLLLSDVVMPLLGGGSLAARLGEVRPDCKVLFLSGYTDDAVIRHGVLVADFAFLQKPVAPAQLAQKVREVLDRVS